MQALVKLCNLGQYFLTIACVLYAGIHSVRRSSLVFWKKRRHALPKFPPMVSQTFKLLCETLDDQQIEELRKAVDQNFLDALENSKTNEAFDIDSARSLVDCCYFLLDSYHEYDEKQQSFIVGAVRYFAIADDPFDDETFATGFYDDMRVMNYVLEDLGIEGRFFDVR